MMFNINDSVKVKLNDLGREIHKNDWVRVLGKNDRFTYHPPEEDADGWSRHQMWHLMEIFGPHIGLGKVLPFNSVIEIIDRKEY
jgi:hypothetical protein